MSLGILKISFRHKQNIQNLRHVNFILFLTLALHSEHKRNLGYVTFNLVSAMNSMVNLDFVSFKFAHGCILIASNFWTVIPSSSLEHINCVYLIFLFLWRAFELICTFDALMWTCSFVHCLALVKLHKMRIYYGSFWWLVRSGVWSWVLLGFPVCKNLYLMMLLPHPLWKRYCPHWKM